MKNLLISSVVAAGLLGGIANAKSGAFVGVNVGVPITTPEYKGGLRTGSEQFLCSWCGFRV